MIFQVVLALLLCVCVTLKSKRTALGVVMQSGANLRMMTWAWCQTHRKSLAGDHPFLHLPSELRAPAQPKFEVGLFPLTIRVFEVPTYWQSTIQAVAKVFNALSQI